jgi:hypothetical protein
VEVAIPQEDTLLRAELQLVRVEGSKIRPTSTPKGTQASIIWLFLEQGLKGREETKDFGGEPID